MENMTPEICQSLKNILFPQGWVLDEDTDDKIAFVMPTPDNLMEWYRSYEKKNGAQVNVVRPRSE